MPRFREGDIRDDFARGWVPPGLDNLGPGNEVRIGPAGRTGGDVDARTHDIGYGDEIEAGVNPYVNWVEADEVFLRDLNPEGVSERIAQGLFSVKKALKNAGVIGDMSLRGKKRKADELPPRESVFNEGEARAAARAARTKRRNDNMETRDSAWDGRGEHFRQMELTAAMEREDDIQQQMRFDDEREEKDEINRRDNEQANWTDLDNWWDNQIPASEIQLPDDDEENWLREDNVNEEMQVDWRNDDVGQHFDSFDNLRDSDHMSVVAAGPVPGDGDGEPEVAAARSSGGGAGSVSKETPVSPYPSLTYGLQETHTTILPWTGWCSMTCGQTGVGSTIQLRMNSIYDFWTTAVTPFTTNPLATGAVYDKPILSDGTISNSFSFPEAMNNATTVETPWWRNYWSQLYEYYTVLGCEWKITLCNPVNVHGAKALVANYYDSYSDTAGSTGNIKPLTNLSELMSFKGVQWTLVEEHTGASSNTTSVQFIQGRYKPGSVKRNIVNDGDVKTWTKTDFNGVAATPSNVPTLKDVLVIAGYRAPLGFSLLGAVNVQVELKYIVQFKDLRSMARYPTTIAGGIPVEQNITLNRTDIGNPIARWA